MKKQELTEVKNIVKDIFYSESIKQKGTTKKKKKENSEIQTKRLYR